MRTGELLPRLISCVHLDFCVFLRLTEPPGSLSLRYSSKIAQNLPYVHPITDTCSPLGSSHNDDPEPEPLRKDLIALALQLPRADIDRDDRREQPDQRRPVEADGARYGAHSHESGHR
jgi:hypothetical protein